MEKESKIPVNSPVSDRILCCQYTVVPCPAFHCQSDRPPDVQHLQAILQVAGWSKMMITFRQRRESIFFFDHPAQCPLVEEDMSCALPKIFMISARSVQQRKKAFNSWASHDVIVYDTTGKFHQNWSLLLFSLH